MKMNQVIRRYRKEQNLTQEQIANYLGVTAPAVNKWESGNSFPDITLLAPLARILKTDVDTLLSVHEELTDFEIQEFVQRISAETMQKSYKEIFEEVRAKIKEFPNCDKLILNASQIMNGYLAMDIHGIEEKEQYQKQIHAWLEQVTFSSEPELANVAAGLLSMDYMTNLQYEEAQKLLDRIPAPGFDKRATQATLYQKQGQHEKAYELTEQMLLQSANNSMFSLMQMTSFLSNQSDYEGAKVYADVAEKAAELFDLGNYVGKSAKLQVALQMQEEEESLRLLNVVTEGMDMQKTLKQSMLYPHIKTKESDNTDIMKEVIRRAFEQDEELDFLRGNPRFQQIMKKLEKWSVQNSEQK